MANTMSVEELITQMLQMGFELEDCHEALAAGKLSVEEAVDWLLQGKPMTQGPTLHLKKHVGSQFDNSGLIESSSLSPCNSNDTMDSSVAEALTGSDSETKITSRLPQSESKIQSLEEQVRKEDDRARRERFEKKKAHAEVLKQIALDKEERRVKLKSGFSKTENCNRAVTNSMQENGQKIAKYDSNVNSNDCLVQVRCTDGCTIKQSFYATDTFSHLWEFLIQQSINCDGMVLMQPFPKREFTIEHSTLTFKELNLLPSCSLVLKPPTTEFKSVTPDLPQDIVSPPSDELQIPRPTHHPWGSGHKLEEAAESQDTSSENLPAPVLAVGAEGGEEQDMDEDIEMADLGSHLWGDGQRLGGEANLVACDEHPILSGLAAQQRIQSIIYQPTEKCNSLILSPTVLSLQDTCVRFIVKQMLECGATIVLNLPSQVAERVLQYMMKEKLLRPRFMQNFLSCHLIHLILDCYPYTTNELLQSVRHHTSLQHVSLVSCTLINDSGLQALVSLKRLLTLNLRGCVQITDNCFSVIAVLPVLNSLSLEETKVTDSGVLKYTSTPHLSLQVLNLNRTNVTANGLTLLFNLTNLRFLSLDGSKVSSLEPLPALERLEGLSIQATTIPTANLKRLKIYPSLVWLNITDMPNVTGDDGLKMITGLPIQHLYLPSRLTTTNVGLLYITAMPLVSLDLTNYINVTDTAIAKLGAVKSLKRLLLSNTKLTDVGLLALQDMSALEVLYVDRTAITDVGTIVFTGMLKLQELSLASTRVKGCFLNNGVLNRCLLLSKLNLSRTRIKIKALRGLCLPNLTLLNVDGTRLACDPSSYLIGCPKLKHVSAKNLLPPPTLEADSDSD